MRKETHFEHVEKHREKEKEFDIEKLRELVGWVEPYPFPEPEEKGVKEAHTKTIWQVTEASEGGFIACDNQIDSIIISNQEQIKHMLLRILNGK